MTEGTGVCNHHGDKGGEASQTATAGWEEINLTCCQWIERSGIRNTLRAIKDFRHTHYLSTKTGIILRPTCSLVNVIHLRNIHYHKLQHLAGVVFDQFYSYRSQYLH